MSNACDKRKAEFISVRVPSRVKSELQRIADGDDRSLSWLVGRVLADYLEHQKPMRAAESATG